MAEASPAPGRVAAASDRFPGALGLNPTRRGQIGATYVTVEIRFHIHYQQFHQTIAYYYRQVTTSIKRCRTCRQ